MPMSAIGLKLVDFGTGVPEPALAIGAVLSGTNDLSRVGAVDANIANIILILAVSACIATTMVEVKIIRTDAPFMLLLSLALLPVLRTGLKRLER